MDRKRIHLSGNSPWEPIVGYSRAVKMATATDEQRNIVGVGDPYVQTRQALANIEKVLAKAGASLNDVVQTRIFVTDISM